LGEAGAASAQNTQTRKQIDGLVSPDSDVGWDPSVYELEVQSGEVLSSGNSPGEITSGTEPASAWQWSYCDMYLEVSATGQIDGVYSNAEDHVPEYEGVNPQLNFAV
jgi:hypothetical protein